MTNDFRNIVPSFSKENREANQAIVDWIGEFAKQERVTPAQTALAWVLAEEPWIVPFPGTTKIHSMDENIEALNVGLTSDEMPELETAVEKIPVMGVGYPEHMMRTVGLRSKHRVALRA